MNNNFNIMALRLRRRAKALTLSSSRRVLRTQVSSLRSARMSVAKRRPSSLCLHSSPQVVKEQPTTIHPMHAHKREYPTTCPPTQGSACSALLRPFGCEVGHAVVYYAWDAHRLYGGKLPRSLTTRSNLFSLIDEGQRSAPGGFGKQGNNTTRGNNMNHNTNSAYFFIPMAIAIIISILF